MKKILLLTSVLILSFSVNSFAQEVTISPKDKYDAALATKLGADNYGMRKYVFCTLITGKDKKDFTKKQYDAAMQGHFTNMTKLAKKNLLVLAGPLSDPEGIKRGIFVFNVETVKEAAELVKTDPAVALGIFKFEMVPYYGSAALMMINEVHPKLQKTPM